MAERDGRTEKPTGKRRGEARKKGQVARSNDINSAIGLLAVLSVLIIMGPRMLSQLRELLSHSLAHAGEQGDLASTGPQRLVIDGMRSFALIMAPILGAALVAGIVASVAQVRFKWSMEALKPRFSALNPKSGIKRVFGLNGLVETAKALIKLAAIGGIAGMGVWFQLPQVGGLVGLPPQDLLGQIGGRIQRIGLEVLAVLMILAALDYVWQRKKLTKSLMMTKEEIKQEARQTDIAPEVRGQIRRKQLQASRRRMLIDVALADVVIVNPTHYAVALKYDPLQPAPQVVAKGADHIAAAIRAAADENEVPIVSNPPLARTIYRQVEIGSLIPEALFVAVAEVLAYVFRTARGRRRRLGLAQARAI